MPTPRIPQLSRIPVILSLIFIASGQQVLAFQATSERLALPKSDEGLPGAGPIRRYGWFQDLWIRRRSQFASSAGTQKGAVVFLGDSITQEWGNDLKGGFPEIVVANRGISGDTTRGMLIRLREDVLGLTPAGVVMLMGTNDLEEQASADTIAANIALIVAELSAHDKEMPIIFCNVFPSSASKKRSSVDIKRINALCSSLPMKFPQVTIVDTWTLFADKSGDASKEEFPDLLHPNEIGYQKWAKALRPCLVSTGLLVESPSDAPREPGFRPLFNGNDLTGWRFKRTSDAMRKSRANWRKKNKSAPAWPIVEEDVAFDGKTQSDDGRFAVIGNSLVVLSPPEGRRIQQLWTAEEFDSDFVLRMQFRAMPNADSGVFIRGTQLQCRDYALAGPYFNLESYRPQEWNDLEIRVSGQQAHCTCNGEVLNAAFPVPASGPIGLEGDRGQIEYRFIRVKSERL